MCPDTTSYTPGFANLNLKNPASKISLFHLLIVYLLCACFVPDSKSVMINTRKMFSLWVLMWISLCGHVFVVVPWTDHGRIKSGGMYLCKMNRIQFPAKQQPWSCWRIILWCGQGSGVYITHTAPLEYLCSLGKCGTLEYSGGSLMREVQVSACPGMGQ